MIKAVKHEHDEGKWQSNFDDYGHGPGNGKSRNAVYKHFKKMESQNIPIEESKFESANWMDDDDGQPPKAKTIPEPLSDMAEGKITELDLKAQSHVIRAAFVGLDRLVTHWGRGVMSDNEWKIDRNSEDYETLTNSTINMLQYYNVQMPVTPPMIWGITVSSAYAGPVSHVMKNRDPSRKRKGIFSRIFRRKKKITSESEENE